MRRSSHQQVALGIDVWSDVMGDLPGVMAQADPTIERYRAEPDRTAVRSFFKDQPQADVMSLVGAPAVRFFEGKLFLFSVIVERADRRIVVGSVKHDAADDVDTRAQRDRIGGKPSGRVHGPDDVFLATDKPDIQRISGNACTGARHHGKSGQAGFMLVMSPKRRKHEVGRMR